MSETGRCADVDVRPLTSGCRAVLERGDHACVGISPFNGYFTNQRITALAGWALATFERAHFFVPDAAAALTLQALGHPPERAAWKARRQGQYVRNKICRALTTLGVTEPANLILDAAALEANTPYRALYTEAHTFFDQHQDFRQACLAATNWVLDRRLPAGSTPTPQQLDLAARYLLAELPLFTDTPTITQTTASVFCYHEAVPFLHQIYHRRLPWQPRPGQGFAVVTFPGT